MTQEQINKLFELKNLFEEGILTKEELEQEKAKILGIELQIKEDLSKNEVQQVVEVVEENQQEPIIEKEVPIVQEEIIDQKSEINSKIEPIEQLKVSIETENISIETPSIEKESIIEKEVPEIIEQKSEINSKVEQIEQLKESARDENISTETPSTNKSKVPLIILGLCLVFGIAFVVLPKLSTNNYSPKESNSQYVNSDTDVDMFESLWQIGSSRRLTYDDLRGLNKSELRILRNFFYAKLNYKFNNDDLKNHFSQYPWYSPINTNVDKKLSKIQTANIQYIKSLE